MRLATTFLVSVGLPAVLLAQTAPVPYQLQTLTIDSGSFDNPTTQPVIVFEQLVKVTGARWLRALLDTATLPGSSYVEFAALQDGDSQRLDGRQIVDWAMGSAYFNGDALLIRLVAGPSTQGVRITSSSILAGQPNQSAGPGDQCGPSDDRTASKDVRVGRIMPQGCTGWLISSTNCFLTAGHCCNDSPTNFNVVQFNVPASLPDGTTQNPPAADQYPINYNSRVFQDQGQGCDWCVFTTNVNGTSGRHAGQVQGSFFTLAGSIPGTGTTVRVTGYGTDTGTANQTLQTHSGPLQSVGATLCYQVDTQGGNSGSPVINESTGQAIGIHTHGGCASGGCNNGTPITHPQLQAAITSVCGGTDYSDLIIYGQACGTKTTWSALAGLGVPKLGSTFGVKVNGTITSVPGVVFFGQSNAFWGQQWLPFDLAQVPGGFTCKVYASIDVIVPVQIDAQGDATVLLAVPNNPWLQGQYVFVQAAVWAPGLNALNIATTNALRGRMANK